MNGAKLQAIGIQVLTVALLALAAYNTGSRKVHEHSGIPPFKATRRCIAKIKIYHQH